MASLGSSSYNVSYPPLDGSLSFPDMITFNATHNATHTLYTFHDEHTNTLVHISHRAFFRACQRVAHAVRPDRRGPDGAVVAILAQCDTLLYHALTMGIVFAGLVPFAMSPRNSAAAVLNMMRKTDCRRLIATRHALGTLLDGIQADSDFTIDIEEAPVLADVYPELGQETTGTPFVPYPSLERPSDNAVMCYLHSSGSTGFPKPIPITHLTAVHWCITPPVLEHIDVPADIHIGAASLPAFHAFGMYIQLFLPVASLTRVCVYAPTSYRDPTALPIFPTPQNAIEAMTKTGATALFVVPAFLETWVATPDIVNALCKLEYVAFAGGPLSKKTGDALVTAGVKLSSFYGATEFSAITYIIRSPAEQALWEWFRFGPNQRIRWAPLGDGTYECHVLTCPTHQVSVENLSDVKGYASADAFVKHPTIEGLYKLVGRVDDVLIHASGEKTVPAPMETCIVASPFVSGVCMFGRGRNQTGVLVEPRAAYAIDETDEKQVAEFRNKIWRNVEEANKEAPAFSRIFKEMILVTSKEKPMLRADKGTVNKKATTKLYESEIDALYTSVETSAKAGTEVSLPLTWSQTEVENWLGVHAMAVNGGKPLEVDTDMFEQGFDSLSSTFFRNRIIGSLAASSDEVVRAAVCQIGQDVIFANPTLRRLTNHLIQLVTGEDASTLSMVNPKAEIESMISKYAADLEDKIDDGVLVATNEKTDQKHVVLLTGSTGGLGSYLLASLLGHENVAAVYAFNRLSKTASIQQRQRAAFKDRGLDIALLDSEKLIYVEGDAAQHNLSLDEQTYDEMRGAVTIIIHNAWRLDFNLALSSFEPNVRGTRHLIDLARASNRAVKPRFLFTSSIASAQGWDKKKGAFPEEVQLDASVAVGPGYGASKYVCERILAISGLPATSFRIGQITGGVPRGAWSTTDWVPIIVKSSVTLGALPEACGVASWLPPQAVSAGILDVAFADAAPPLAVNLVHPRPIAWRSIMESLSEAVYQKHITPSRLGLIPFSEWVVRLNAYAVDASEANLKRVPGIKLHAFMRSLADGDAARRREEEVVERSTAEAAGFTRFETEVAERASETMRALAPMPAEDVGCWVDYWASVGMFVSEGV